MSFIVQVALLFVYLAIGAAVAAYCGKSFLPSLVASTLYKKERKGQFPTVNVADSVPLQDLALTALLC